MKILWMHTLQQRILRKNYVVSTGEETVRILTNDSSDSHICLVKQWLVSGDKLHNKERKCPASSEWAENISGGEISGGEMSISNVRYMKATAN